MQLFVIALGGQYDQHEKFDDNWRSARSGSGNGLLLWDGQMVVAEK
jgi:hypothetical protein